MNLPVTPVSDTLDAERRAEIERQIILEMAECGPSAAYQLAWSGHGPRIGLGDTLDVLGDLVNSGTVIRHDPDLEMYALNPDTVHETYARVLPLTTADQLIRLATIDDRPTEVFGSLARNLYEPLRAAVKVEIAFRLGQLDALKDQTIS